MATVKVPASVMLSREAEKFENGDQQSVAHESKARTGSKIETCPDMKESEPCLRARERHHKDYEEAIFDLNSLQSNAKTISLAKYKSPQEILPLFAKQLNLVGIHICDLDQLNIVHISGTKGKGSSCAFVESILRAHGLKTGFYNSPHLINVTERIRINGSPIDNALFTKYFREIYDRLDEETKREGISMPTYFSFLTILAFHIFIEERVDCAVIEVGIGGEYDPTNIIQQPVACGISTVHFDHVNILGDSIESIAWSKAGIAKREVPIFTVDQEHKAALEVIETRAREKSCPLYICKPMRSSPDLRLGIRGSAQMTNASLAVQIARYFLKKRGPGGDSPGEIAAVTQTVDTTFTDLSQGFQEALASCSWPGRCQIVKYPNSRLTFFLDGAHTKESMDNCIEWFLQSSVEEDCNASRILMVNIIGERDKSEILRPLCHREYRFDETIFSTNRTSPGTNDSKSESYSKDPSDRGMENARYNADTWNRLLKERGISNQKLKVVSNTSDGMEHVIKLSQVNPSKNYHVLATGSLHFVGAMLETLRNIS